MCVGNTAYMSFADLKKKKKKKFRIGEIIFADFESPPPPKKKSLLLSVELNTE